MKKTLLFLLLSFCAINFQAQTEDPRHPLFPKTQPDGKPLAVRMYGGAHADYVFYTTTDSIALVLDDNGAYCYARPSAGHLVSTGVIAHEPADRDAAEQAVAANTPRLNQAMQALLPRAARRRIAPQRNELTSVSSDGIGTYGKTLGGKVNSIGEYKLPVVLVQFNDRSFQDASTDEKFDAWLNDENYTDGGAAGSVRQYFVDQSKGLFVPNFEVIARVTLDSGYAHYGCDNGDSHDVNLFSIFLPEVFNKLKQKGVNLNRFQDSRTNNCIPLVAILYAGTGQAQSAQADDIWPCEMDLGADYSSYTAGYRVNSVFFGNEWAYGKMNGLGTFCHEFGHALGLPDIYATKYGHSNPLAGYWDIMQSGCYVEGGFRPMDYTAHEKNQLGWLKLYEPTEPHVYTLYPMTDDREPHALLLRNPENSAEYYILENRQVGRWSGEAYGKGLLAMHIDYSASMWSANNVNNDGDHPRTVVVAACGTLSNSSNDLFPYGSIRTLHDKSNPATKVYTGSGLKHPVYTIRANSDGTVTLSYGSASAPAYFVGDTVYVASSKLTCVIPSTKELKVVAAPGGYSGDISVPDDSIYFDHQRYRYTAISQDAFANCEGLTSVYIGNCVREVEPGAFAGSPLLTSITLSEENKNLELVNGVLYSAIPDASTIESITATADFGTNAQGLPVATSLKGYAGCEVRSYVEDGLTITTTDAETPAFLWNTTGGTRLRMSKDATLTVAAPAGYTISNLTFVANTLNLVPQTGAIATRTWTGEPVNTVVFTCSGTNTIASITATIQRDNNDRHLIAAPATATGDFIVDENTTAIDAYALSQTAYTSITIPTTVTYIGAEALSVSTLSDLYVLSDTPIELTADPFTNVPETCTLHIPQGTTALYKAAPYWQRFFPRMEEDAATAIARITAPSSVHGTSYDLLGRPVNNPQGGIYILDGKKVLTPTR